MLKFMLFHLLSHLICYNSGKSTFEMVMEDIKYYDHVMRLVKMLKVVI
jgi:hypothetical protein